MGNPYNPKRYWEERLTKSFNLRGVGHIGFTRSYNAWLYRRKQRCLRKCFRDAPIQGIDVLDVGCGTGFFVQWYLQHGANVVGIDITEVSVNELRQKCRGEFFTQDIASPDYKPYRRFDVVNMWDVMYHIVEPSSFHQALDNISKSVKQGGRFIFTDWFGASDDIRIADHVQARCLGTYQRALGERGFELAQIYPLFNWLNKRHLGTLDNCLGCLFFLLEGLSRGIPSDNLSVAVWRRTASDRTP
jgi:SAM-dependent methyltransferase